MSKLVIVAVVAVLGVVGAGGWYALRDAPSAPGGPDFVPDTPTPGGGTRPADRARPAPEPKLPADEEGPPIPEMAAEPVLGAGLTFKFSGCSAGELVDWNRIGIQCRRAQRLLRKAASRIRQGDQEPLGTMSDGVGDAYFQVMFSSREFVRSVISTRLDMNTPVTTTMAFPPFQSNAIAATLAAWDRPLSAPQVEALQAIFDDYYEQWDSVRSRSPADTWPIERIAEASLARAAIQPKIEAVLDERQRSALWPPSVKGRVGLDPFSPAILWWGRIQIVECPEGKSLPKFWTDTILSELMIEVDLLEPRRPIVAEWIAALPKNVRDGLKGPLSRAGLPSWDEIAAPVAGTPELARRLREGWNRPDLPLQRSPRLLLPVVVTR